ncbi:GntR family transcriptional regulator [Rhodococcus kroppenstedtii]|uniref:GntR family transcriptional regulator n=1 Tax=Rhodococcoides kroppenstedtii TaxID=293050 RepID=UPI001C9A3A77|nr:GntR family transcriptional regulator [Rhodococcus kroppenstedtii]MBY6436434.1 GntR family transcriptional regulator [Rhodococcus kroppenstedtii]
MRNTEPTSADRAYTTVKELIVSGELPGGELISEGQIAARTGTSRTPVREAFLRLAAEGWMRLYPKRGALIVPIAPDEAAHIVDARRLVETGSLAAFADDAATRSAVADLMRASLGRQRALAEDGDAHRFAAEDADFHTLVVTHGANPLLSTFYSGLRDRQRRMTTNSVARNPEAWASIVDDHTRLTALVEQGDVAGFEVALSRHMAATHSLPHSRGLS